MFWKWPWSLCLQRVARISPHNSSVSPKDIMWLWRVWWCVLEAHGINAMSSGTESIRLCLNDLLNNHFFRQTTFFYLFAFASSYWKQFILTSSSVEVQGLIWFRKLAMAIVVMLFRGDFGNLEILMWILSKDIEKSHYLLEHLWKFLKTSVSFMMSDYLQWSRVSFWINVTPVYDT